MNKKRIQSQCHMKWIYFYLKLSEWYNFKTCAKVAACHYIIQSNGNEKKKWLSIRKEYKEIKKNEWCGRKNSTHQLNGSQTFFFFYCTVYADEFGFMCLSYCDDDVVYRYGKRSMNLDMYIRLTQHCIQFCKWKLRTIKICFKSSCSRPVYERRYRNNVNFTGFIYVAIMLPVS